MSSTTSPSIDILTSQCPTEDVLDALIRGDLPEPEQTRVTAHLDTCHHCQAALDRLTCDLRPLTSDLVPANSDHRPSTSDVVPANPDLRPLTSDLAPSALIRLIEQIKDESPIMHFDSSSTGGDSPAPLDFLSPADDPSHLGRLGRYLVQEEIGRGASGIVLKALDERLGRIVALKVLSPRLATNEHARRRFVREARAAAAIRDDHVIGIHHVEEVDGLPFLVMEYIVGRSVQQRMDATGPLPLADILRIGSQIARGLAAAHTQGLVHRDIKPANILLENGVERVKITDFGLAHAVDDVRATQPGVVIGTPEYMSPQQARGERVDHRSDLFSLGCVLYGLSAGRPPFRADSTVATLKRICEDTPRPLSEINADVPSWLADIIDRLMSKDPADRFQSAAEIAELLEQCLADVQRGAGVSPAMVAGTLRVPSPLVGWDQRAQLAPAHLSPATSPLSPVPSASHSAFRNSKSAITRRRLLAPSYWPLAACLLLLAAVLLASETAGLTTLSSTIIRIVRGDGTLVVEIDDPSIQVLLDGDEISITGAGPKELRLRPGKHELQTVTDGKPADTKVVTVTKGGRDVVRVTREPPSSKEESGTVARQVSPSSQDSPDEVSQDGHYVTYTDWTTGDIALRELRTGITRRLTKTGSLGQQIAYGMYALPSPDGVHVAYTWHQTDRGQRERHEIRVADFDGGEPKSIYHDADAYPQPLGWSSAGDSVIVSLWKDDHWQIAVLPLTGGSAKVVKTIQGRRTMRGNIAFAHKTQLLAYGKVSESDATNRDIYVIDVSSGAEFQLTGHAGDEDVLAWAPDGSHLLIDMERRGVRDAWLLRVHGNKVIGEPRLVKHDVGLLKPLGVTREGKFYYSVVQGGSNIFVGDFDWHRDTAIAARLPVERLTATEMLSACGWSPNGNYLAYSASSRGHSELRIASVQGGETRVLQPQINFQGRLGRWSPDGSSLLVTAQQEQSKTGIYQIDLTTADVKTLVPAADDLVQRVGGYQWSANGQGIYYRSKPKEAIVYRDLTTSEERELLKVQKLNFNSPGRFEFAVSPGGRHVAAYGPDKGSDSAVIRVFSIADSASRELVTMENRRSLGESLAWSPDGQSLLYRRLAATEEERGLYVVPVAGGVPRKIELSGVDAKTIGHVVVSPNGKKIAITAFAVRNYEIWVLENFLPPLDDLKPAATSNVPAQAVPATQPSPTSRLVWAKSPDPWFMGRPSPDGKHISHIDWTTGSLAVCELATGTSRVIAEGSWENWEQLGNGLHSIFSPDGKHLAYLWQRSRRSGGSGQELRVIGVDGTGQRTLSGEVSRPFEWSPDGTYILSLIGKSIGLVALADGKSSIIKSLPDDSRTDELQMSLSPDGRYVAYSIAAAKASGKRDIFLLPIHGGQEVPLVTHPADDFILGWSPDGSRVVFASDRTGSVGVWTISVADGKTLGNAQLAKAEMGRFSSLGMTPTGTLHYGVFSGGQNVFTATVDFEKGQLVTPPVEAMQRVEGANWSPAWSPDGKYLACLAHPNGRTSFFYIRDNVSGEVRELAPPNFQLNVHSLNWSSDSRALVGAGRIEGDKWGALRIDVESGAASYIARDTLFAPLLADEGRVMYFKDGRGIVRRDLQSGADQVMYQSKDSLGLALSPEGDQLAFAEGGSLKVVSASGGEPRDLLTGEGWISTLAWMPDGKHLIVQRWDRRPGGKSDENVARELLRISTSGGQLQKLDIDLPALQHLRIHPDGRQIAFTAKSAQDKCEIWALEKFLPPAGDPKSAAASASVDANDATRHP